MFLSRCWWLTGAWLLTLLCFTALPAAAQEGETTFTRDVAPILQTACVACHAPGKPAPFALLTYSDARRRASQLVQVTQSGYMPPWKTITTGFQGERHLTPEQKATLKRWLEAGAREGERVRATPPAAPSATDWPFGPPDQIVKMPKVYTLLPNTLETTRCFLIPSATTGDRYLRAIAFRPSNPKAVRYISLYADTSGEAKRQEALSGGIGYFGFTGGLFPSPAGSLADWSPGAVSQPLPPGFGVRVAKGTDLILQIRFHPTGKAENEQTEVGLYFTGDSAPLEPITLRLGAAPLYLPKNSSAVLTDSFLLPTAVRVLDIVPNAHYTARTFLVTASLPDGKTMPLLDIPDWDANWKQPYRLETPRTLPAGTRLALKIEFDNTEENPRNPWRPSHRVVPGLEFMEEMSSAWLRLLPATAAERGTLTAALPDPRHAPMIDIDEREPEGFSARRRPGPPTPGRSPEIRKQP